MDERNQPILSEKQLRRAGRYTVDRRVRRAAAALVSRSYSKLSDVDYYLWLLGSPAGVPVNHSLIAAEALRFASLTPDQQIRVEEVARARLSNRQI